MALESGIYMRFAIYRKIHRWKNQRVNELSRLKYVYNTVREQYVEWSALSVEWKWRCWKYGVKGQSNLTKTTQDKISIKNAMYDMLIIISYVNTVILLNMNLDDYGYYSQASHCLEQEKIFLWKRGILLKSWMIAFVGKNLSPGFRKKTGFLLSDKTSFCPIRSKVKTDFDDIVKI